MAAGIRQNLRKKKGQNMILVQCFALSEITEGVHKT